MFPSGRPILIFLCASFLIACGDSKKEGNSNGPKTDTLGKDSLAVLLKNIDFIIYADSVKLENSAEFSEYKFDTTNKEESVDFTLKVTNLGKTQIPTIQTARWKSGLQIIINGNNEMGMSLANMSHGGDEALQKDATDTWTLPFQISGENKVNYGNPFTFQWVYMNINSPVLQVDIVKKKITIIE